MMFVMDVLEQFLSELDLCVQAGGDTLGYSSRIARIRLIPCSCPESLDTLAGL